MTAPIRIAVLGALASAACGGSVPATRYYHLAPPPVAAHATGTAVLVLEPLTTDAGYDDERMVYRVNPYRFDYYDYHRWSAAPGVLVGDYLETALQRSGRFRSVVREKTSEATLVLTGRVAAIEEVDQSRRAWSGHIVVELRLTDVKTGEVMWSQEYDETEPMPRQTPEGLARALSTAMARVVGRAAPVLGDLADRQATARADHLADQAADHAPSSPR